MNHNPRTKEFVHLENNWPLILGKQWCPIQLCLCSEICSAKRHKDTVCCMLAGHQKKETCLYSVTFFGRSGTMDNIKNMREFQLGYLISSFCSAILNVELT